MGTMQARHEALLKDIKTGIDELVPVRARTAEARLTLVERFEKTFRKIEKLSLNYPAGAVALAVYAANNLPNIAIQGWMESDAGLARFDKLCAHGFAAQKLSITKDDVELVNYGAMHIMWPSGLQSLRPHNDGKWLLDDKNKAQMVMVPNCDFKPWFNVIIKNMEAGMCKIALLSPRDAFFLLRQSASGLPTLKDKIIPICKNVADMCVDELGMGVHETFVAYRGAPDYMPNAIHTHDYMVDWAKKRMKALFETAPDKANEDLALFMRDKFTSVTKSLMKFREQQGDTSPLPEPPARERVMRNVRRGQPIDTLSQT